jgi:hypothetical protein
MNYSYYAKSKSKREMFVYFNNWITITFDLANKGQHVNECSIMLTQLLVELTRWIQR